jgi:hypothetical protein
MTYVEHLIERYNYIRTAVGEDRMRQIFSGAKASLTGKEQIGLGPNLREKLLSGYEEAEPVLFPDSVESNLDSPKPS